MLNFRNVPQMYKLFNNFISAGDQNLQKHYFFYLHLFGQNQSVLIKSLINNKKSGNFFRDFIIIENNYNIYLYFYYFY